MITIAIYSLKGGVGKTITAANLAQMYATRRSPRVPGAKRNSIRKTLLIDCDPQGNASQYLKRYDAADTCGLMRDEMKSVGTDFSFLEIVPGNMELYDLERELYAEKKTNVISHIFADNDPFPYDLAILDCPPAMNMLTVNALCAAAYVIIPIRPDAFSSQGLVELNDQLKDVRQLNPRLHVLGILLTHYRHTKTCQEAERLLRQYFPVFDTVIDQSDHIPESTLKQKPLAEMGMNLKPAWQYRKLLKEIIVRIGQHRKGVSL